MSRNRKPSNITVHLLKPFRFQDKDGTWYGNDSKFGVVFTERGPFLLIDEGVGYYPDEEVQIYLRPLEEPTNPDSEVQFTLLPPKSVAFPVSAIDASDTTGETETLEIFIRSFGNRQETNYAIWLRNLKKEKVVQLEEKE